MKKLDHKNLNRRKKKIEKRLERRNWEDQLRPMFQGSNVHYEVDGRNKGIAQGGIGVMHRLAKTTGLVKAIDQKPAFIEAPSSLSRIRSRAQPGL